MSEPESREAASFPVAETGERAPHVLEQYLSELKVIRASGAGGPETSYYPALSNLFNAVGKTLKPKVRCVMNLRNLGAGMPDGGLFTGDQFQRQGEEIAPKEGQLPARGAIEAKGTKTNVKAIAATQQVKDYLNAYGIVIVTNLREFLIVERGTNGQPAEREAFALAGDEQDFWQHKAAHPRGTAQEQGARFFEFIKRACLHAAALSNAKDVAWFLASYARDALARVEARKELPALAMVRQALEEALGMKFTGEKGEHFFRSTLVQTLFYGVFSAWVLWHKNNPRTSAKFDWRAAEWTLQVPFIRTLYHQVAEPDQLGQLGLVEVLDWTAGVLNRVDRAQFFATFEEGHAVQYFYEPFLEAFDPELRKELGVWYTPHEVVQYMVARVDAVLKEELEIPDGLADKRVFVLDPCCGTGAYLVEVLRRVAETLRDKGGDALAGQDLKHAAMERVFGFEILPAPFVVAHLQLGLLLQHLNAPLSEKQSERVGVYLTNALTGWEPPKEPKTRLLFPELEEEREAADKVKRDTPILVILGNPPYNGFAGVAVKEERELTTAYRTGKKVAAPQGQGLNDLYVRFFRMAERRIVEMNKPAKGVVCFISNYSWLDGLSFTAMRERYLEVFDHVWVDCLNGDKYKTGKLTPEGEPDPSVFSTEYNREGIQVGTAITLMVRKEKHADPGQVQFRHFWGKTKRAQLDKAATQPAQRGYEKVTPVLEMGLPFMPSQSTAAYFACPLLPELFPVSFPGVKTSRDDFLVDVDKGRLTQRLKVYFDPKVSHDDMRREYPGIMQSTARYKAEEIRDKLRKRGFLADNIVRYSYRPFDLRWLYWEPETKLLDEKREEYFPHVFEGNRWIEARQKQPMEAFDRGYVVRVLSDNFGNGLSSYFPLYLSGPHVHSGDLFAGPPKKGKVPNLSEKAKGYLAGLELDAPEPLFFHAVAVLHAPAYREENAGALRQDWPRVPLPDSLKALEASAELGAQVAALLDTEADVPGVTSGKIGPALKTIGLITKSGGGQLDAAGSDLAVTAGWGHSGKGGVTMPAKGKLDERSYLEAEAKAIEAEAQARGLSAQDALGLLGAKTYDVWLNGVAYWRNIPANVWEFHIGGYQVIKKWLSYREEELLGRALKPEEAREVMNMARRIAALVLLQPALDENYRRVKAATYAWTGEPQRTEGPGAIA